VNALKITQMAEDVVRLLQGWGVYSHRDTENSGKYESKYTVHVDYRDLLTELDAKVVILDGTADISPMYDEDYIHMLPTRGYTRSLSYLTIKLCDLPTSESDMRDDMERTAQMIRSYLDDVTHHDQSVVIFSNEKMEMAFRKSGHNEGLTGHFNNIKGLNAYSTALNIAQVGLNRKPPVDYLTLDLARNEEIRSKLSEDTRSLNPVIAMNNARKAMEYNVKTMTAHVLADLEQNLYRGIIRNADNTQPFTYYVFFEHEQYKELIKEINKRYGPLNAKIEMVSRDKIEAFKPKSIVEQRIDLIQAWLKDWDGKPIRQSAVYKKFGMTRTEFNNTLAHEYAQEIRYQINEAKEKAKTAGYKTGWLIR